MSAFRIYTASFLDSSITDSILVVYTKHILLFVRTQHFQKIAEPANCEICSVIGFLTASMVKQGNVL